MLIVAILASICAAAAMAIIIYWMTSTATRFYVEGQLRMDDYLVDRDDTGQGLAALAKKFGVIFLPVVESMRDNDRFGVPLMLARWEDDLVRAGLRATLTAEQLLCTSWLLAIVLGGVFALASTVFGMGLGGALILGAPAGVIVGLVLPSYLVKNKGMERIAIIEKRLPYAIEFMLLAMEASAALPEAMSVYASLMPDDPLGDEFRLVLADIDRGLSQVEALRAMDERLKSDSLSAFILAVSIGLDTGQPIKDVFQSQADATRQRRYAGAEEVAKKAGTKAIMPLFVVLIGIIILILGPMGIKIMRGGLF